MSQGAPLRSHHDYKLVFCDSCALKISKRVMDRLFVVTMTTNRFSVTPAARKSLKESWADLNPKKVTLFFH